MGSAPGKALRPGRGPGRPPVRPATRPWTGKFAAPPGADLLEVMCLRAPGHPETDNIRASSSGSIGAGRPAVSGAASGRDASASPSGPGAPVSAGGGSASGSGAVLEVGLAAQPAREPAAKTARKPAQTARKQAASNITIRCGMAAILRCFSGNGNGADQEEGPGRTGRIPKGAMISVLTPRSSLEKRNAPNCRY